MFPLDLHFHALGTVGSLMHGGTSCAFDTEKRHNLLIGDLPEFEASNDGHLFVSHTLGFDEELRDGASENFLPSFNELFFIKQGDLIAFFHMLGDNLEYHVLVGFVLRVILTWGKKLGEYRVHLNEAFTELQLILLDIQSRQVSKILQRVELLMRRILDSPKYQVKVLGRLIYLFDLDFRVSFTATVTSPSSSLAYCGFLDFP